MGKTLIIKGADFSANAINPIKVLTIADFTVRQGYYIDRNANVFGNPQELYSGGDTPISEYVGRQITITAQPNSPTWIVFTNKAFADSIVGENITVSTMTRLTQGESIRTTIPSNAQYLYTVIYAEGINVCPSEINIW